MERGEVAAELYLAQHFLIDEGALGEELPSLHYTVPYGLYVLKRLEHAVLRIGQLGKYELHPRLVVGNGQDLFNLVLAGGPVCEASFRQSDFFDYALGNDIINIIALHVKQLILY